MVKIQDAAAIVVGTLVAIALFVWVGVEVPSAGTPPAGTSAPAARGVSDVPRIDLARLEAHRTSPAAGRRDVFDFASSAPAHGGEDSGGAPVPPPTLSPVPIEATPPPPPSLTVRFIGAVEKGGAKVAVLMTDKKEILTGQTGDVVANRLRIVRIGLESVDVQDVSGGAPRRLPLRAN